MHPSAESEGTLRARYLGLFTASVVTEFTTQILQGHPSDVFPLGVALAVVAMVKPVDDIFAEEAVETVY